MTELTVAMTEHEARRVTERIRAIAVTVKDQLEKLQTLLNEARDGEAWRVLGYASWTAYLTDVMGEQPYVLEVSSPGTDRPLTLPRHFARNVGRLVTVTLDDESKVAGRITRADAQTVQVTPEQGGKKAGAATDAEPARLNYTSITGAKVQVEFTRGDDADAVGEDV